MSNHQERINREAGRTLAAIAAAVKHPAIAGRTDEAYWVRAEADDLEARAAGGFGA